MMRSTLFAIVLCGAALGALSAPARCRADSSDDGPAMFSYGFRGFWTGAELGLATGFLATGSRYESGEWRKLVLGTGIGAIIGVAGGVTLGVVDASDASRPRYGWLVLRDMGYGATLGALTGAAVGLLVWVDDGRPKDVLIGLSVGALIGAAAGVVFGIVEGLGSRPKPRDEHARASERGVRLSLLAVPQRGRGLSLGPALLGRF
jgi:hypothetical protein